MDVSAPQQQPNMMHAQNTMMVPQQRADVKPERKKKKRKDPSAPKRACNAYMVFCKAMRPELKEKNPGMTFGKIGAQLGVLWRGFSAEQKRPYEEKAAQEREVYKKRMDVYEGKVASENDKVKVQKV